MPRQENYYLNVKKADKVINGILSANGIIMPSSYYHKLGRFYARIGKFDDAIREFRAAIKINKNTMVYYFDLASALTKAERYKDALFTFEKILKCVPRYHVPPVVFCGKGIAEGSLGKYKQSLASFRRVLELKNKNCVKCASVYSNIGSTYMRLQEYPTAIKYDDKAIRFNPRDGRVWNLSGNCYGFLRNHKRALECFERALKIAPDDIEASTGKCLALGYLGKYKTALELSKRVLRVSPRNVRMLRLKADLLRWSGRYEESLRDLNQLLKIEPTDDNLIINKAIVLGKLNRHEEKLDNYRKALKFNPNSPGALALYGRELIIRGNFNQGIKCIDKSIKISPKGISASKLGLRAVAYKGLRKYDRAIIDLKKAIKLDNRTAVVLFQSCLRLFGSR